MGMQPAAADYICKVFNILQRTQLSFTNVYNKASIHLVLMNVTTLTITNVGI